MSEFKLTQVSMILLGVRELAPSLAFYRDRLGLTVRNEIPGFAFLDAGPITLALSEPVFRASANSSGAEEVVFAVAHVREAYEGLRAKGVEFTQEPRNVNGPFWAANFNDPDGHKLSIFGNE